MAACRFQHVFIFYFLCLSCQWQVWPIVIGCFLVGLHPPWLVLLSIQINGVDMTEARHDQAVALLTGTSPTISLLVERDPKAPMGSPGQSRARAHSPPPPAPSDSPDQEEEGLSLHGNHLSQMEDEYPIEVRPLRNDFSLTICWLCSLDCAAETALRHFRFMFGHLALTLSLMLSSSREDGAWYEGFV